MSLGIYMVEAEEAWYEEAVQASSGMQPAAAHFTIYDRADLRPVGTTALMAIDHRNGRARFGILLGERRSSGLGTEATRLALDWAFTILGLRNVLLEVLPWNTRAIRAYEKAGFRRIGARREAIVSLGERTDEILMDAVASEFTGSVLRPRELGP
jgi:RimJ/RimL family protein N-acetyltransferase